jgi:hypothetical protein
MASKVMNNVNFFTSKICLILPFLCRPEFKIFPIEILHDGYVQHFLHLRFFPNSLTLQNVFFNYEK